MEALSEEMTVLLPIDASEPQAPPKGVLDLLGPHKVVLLGYYQVPDQTMTGQARKQFGEEATAAVSEIAKQFEEQSAVVDSTVVFTHNVSKTIDNTAYEYEVDAVLSGVKDDRSFDRVFVPLRGDVLIEQIVSFVALMFATRPDVKITLFNVPENEEEQSSGEFLLRGAKDRLRESGFAEDQLTWKQGAAVSATDAILEAANEHDLLVVGESEPSLRERLMGTVSTELIDESPVPVLIIRE